MMEDYLVWKKSLSPKTGGDLLPPILNLAFDAKIPSHPILDWFSVCLSVSENPAIHSDSD